MEDSLLELGIKPIRPDSPTGDSARYEESYEALQDEVAKLESLREDPVNWENVVNLGEEILSSLSKDLMVGCYFCHGLYETQKYSGLAVGFTVIRDMVREYWIELYPDLKRMRARISAIKWLVDRLADSIANNKPSLECHETVAQCVQLAEELESLVNEKLGDSKPIGENEPHWAELLRTLRSFEVTLGHEKSAQEVAINRQEEHALDAEPAAPKTKIEATVNAKPVEQESIAVKSDIASEQDADKALRMCKDLLKKVSAFKRDRSLEDSQHYYLLRMAIWSDIELPVSTNGITQVRAPAQEKASYLESLFADKNHEELVRESEICFASSPFWLSLHRYTANALQELGYAQAHKAVIGQFASLLQRFPMLPECKFVNGDTFADELTREWIHDEVLFSGVSYDDLSGMSEGGASNDRADRLEISKEAKELVANGNYKEAANLIKQKVRSANTGRDEFLWRLEEARLWQQSGHLEVALSQLEALNDQVNRVDLEYWDPELSVQIAELLLAWYKRIEAKDSLSLDRSSRKEIMRSRVSRLNAVRAIKIFGNAR